MLQRLTAVLLVLTSGALAQRGGGGGRPNPPLASLKTVAAPTPAGLERYVRDEAALVALGKAFFWDIQAGSDGRTACATCHFHAGADHRVQHQLSGPDAVMNQRLTETDFPFHKLSNPGNNRSAVLSDKRQVAGSMGVVAKAFADVAVGSDVDVASEVTAPSPFAPKGVHLRQVTARNAPTVINAVFNARNFWDGRASSIFTGATPFGDSDTGLRVLAFRDGKLEPEALRLEKASLASQAAGPALNSAEMSWAGRSWPQLGRKLLNLAPLARQRVALTDSVLGAMANPLGNGLLEGWSYRGLIQAAFRPEFHSATEYFEDYTQMEHNFALFWSLAILSYERTLVADDSRVDRFLEGQADALTPLEQQGLNEFRNGGSQCLNCHNGAETTAAGWSVISLRAGNIGSPADEGFFRIGVRPLADDAGLGGKDDFGYALYAGPGNPAGTFKAPGLRNVEFTGPYFHNGGQATLEQVLDFYARNGDFPDDGNLGPGIGNIRLSPADRAAIVAFLKALSDDRVRFQKAPFDHPSLCVPVGHVEAAPGEFETDPEQSGVVALDRWGLVPEVGREGAGVPLQTFDEMLRGIGNDGTRANTLTRACRP